MKKLMSNLLVLSILFILTACSTSKDTAECELDLGNLVSQDGSYGWHDISFGSSMEDVEKALNIEFPSIPYFSSEWVDGTLPASPDEIFDYRNDDDYESVQYAAYCNGTPILVKYGDYRGHLVFEFSHGELRCINVIFGQQATIRDEKMNYGGYSNDVDAVFTQLKTDLEGEIGAYTQEKLNQYPDYEEPYYCWDSSVDIGDGYESRISLYRERNLSDSQFDTTLLIISRIRYQDGEWTY